MMILLLQNLYIFSGVIMISIFEALTLMILFAVFLIALLNYIDKRK